MISAVYPPDPEFDPQRVMIFWRQGLDTCEISRLLGMNEEEVADILWRTREEDRAAAFDRREVA
jgi:hypothetical protein